MTRPVLWRSAGGNLPVARPIQARRASECMHFLRGDGMHSLARRTCIGMFSSADRLIAAIVMAIALSWPAQNAVAQDHASPKKLFQWQVEPSSEEPTEESEDRIVTDRPHFSEASALVGLGRVQLETGFSYF